MEKNIMKEIKQNMNRVKEQYLTCDDLCNQFGISKRQAYAMCKKEGFPSIKIGNRIYIDPIEYEKWLREQIKN